MKIGDNERRPAERRGSEELMDSTRRTAAIVGGLFVVATLAGVASAILLEPVLRDGDLLAAVSANDTRVVAAVLLDVILAAAVIAIPILLFLILRRQNEGIAHGYFAARLVEGIVILAGALGLLVLVSVGRDSVAAGATTVLGPAWIERRFSQRAIGPTWLVPSSYSV
jgi:hypothetical protein